MKTTSKALQLGSCLGQSSAKGTDTESPRARTTDRAFPSGFFISKLSSFHLHLSTQAYLRFDNSLHFLISHTKSSCLATTQISSCAASNPAFPSAACVTNATANAPCAIPTCAQPPSSVSAMSAPSVTTRTSVPCAVERESVMHSTASNVHGWRRTATGAQRLSIWEVREQICSTKRKVSGINDQTPGYLPLWVWPVSGGGTRCSMSSDEKGPTEVTDMESLHMLRMGSMPICFIGLRV